MIDIYTNGARCTMDKIKQFSSSPTGIYLYTLITGMIGILILLSFLSMVFATTALPLLLPAIIGFNGAASGYGITEKRYNNFTYKQLNLISIAILLTVTGCISITLFCPWESLLDSWRYLISGSSALLFTFLGAWIAAKSKKLTKSS